MTGLALFWKIWHIACVCLHSDLWKYFVQEWLQGLFLLLRYAECRTSPDVEWDWWKCDGFPRKEDLANFCLISQHLSSTHSPFAAKFDRRAEISKTPFIATRFGIKKYCPSRKDTLKLIFPPSALLRKMQVDLHFLYF